MMRLGTSRWFRRLGLLWLLFTLVNCGMAASVAARPDQAAAHPVQSTTSPVLYVSPSGSDANPGTRDAPFKTIQRAVGQAQPGATILVRDGVYHEEVIFDHGGTESLPISLRAYPGERPVIDGSMDVTGWTRVQGNVWQARFVHVPGVVYNGATPRSGFEDAASESSCPDAYDYSGDRRAYLYVDEPTTPDKTAWLKPICLGRDTGINSPADLPRGSFATDVPPPPLPGGSRYEKTANTVYVHLADGSDPNGRRIRIAAYAKGMLFVGPSVGYITVQGLSLRLALGSVTISGQQGLSHHITFDGVDVSLTKLRFESDFCTTFINILNSHFHDNEYENIHLESDNSLIANNLIERTVAPWSLYGAVGINVLGVDNRISGNRIRDIHKSEGGRGGYGIYLEEWYNGYGDVGCHSETNQSNVIEKNNVARVDGTGIANSGGDNNIVANNVVYANGAAGIAMSSGGTDGGPVGAQRSADNNSIYHNTLYANADVGLSLNRLTNGVARDNLLYANNPSRGQQVYSAPIGVSFSLDHNLNGGAGAADDPLFVNASAGDFHLQPGSPAIDAGLDVGIDDDMDGNPRPVGLGVDVGAYERQADRPAPTATAAPALAILQGQARLQGRRDHSGVTVQARTATSTSAADGSFSLSLATGAYTVTASMGGYLSSQTNVTLQASPTPQTLPPLLLVGGDANHNGAVDLADLVMVGSSYGLPVAAQPWADINDDGEIGLADLTLVGANYGLQGYQPWQVEDTASPP